MMWPSWLTICAIESSIKPTADGVCDAPLPALRLSRFSAPSDLVAAVYESSLCPVA
jgi:hypothetical protein